MTRGSLQPIASIVLAAGMGTRMRSGLPKALQPLGGVPLLHHALAPQRAIGADPIVVIVGPDALDVEKAAAPHRAVIQADRLGTGHAVLQAREHLADFTGDVLVTFGDTPFIAPETLELMVAARRQDPCVAAVALGFTATDPTGYGRLILDAGGRLARIVEERDADEEELATDLCNGGAICLDGAVMWDLLSQIGADNAKGEYYLTEIVSVANARGFGCVIVEADETEVMGVDSKTDLANAETILRDRLRDAALGAGVTMIDPATVHLSADTMFGRDVTIEPNVFIGPGVTVGDNVTIRAFCHIERATLEAGVSVGPFARLRGGVTLAQGAEIGNFVEVKQAAFRAGAKAKHLAYIGDAEVGEGANIGAGTITCNYNGHRKNQTIIEAGAFVGSNTALIAPVTIGAGSIVGAGSAIDVDVPANSLALARSSPIVKPNRGLGARTEKEKP